MLIALGHDLQHVPELAATERLREPGVVFTAAELAHVRSASRPDVTLAGLFAAKEALFKALPGARGCYWTDIEVRHLPTGAPHFTLTGAAEKALGEGRLALSISHSGEYASAVVVLWREGGP